MLIRIIYSRSGEILTVVMMMTILFYLVMSLEDARKILKNEQQAQDMLTTLCQLENEAEDGYLPLSSLQARSPLLSLLKRIPLGENSSAELFSDDKYLYLFRLVRITSGADDYISRNTAKRPSGFKMLAWPGFFANTGEMAYYVDERCLLAYSSNRKAIYNGLKSFPPDLNTPGRALDLYEKGTEDIIWKVENLNEKN